MKCISTALSSLLIAAPATVVAQSSNNAPEIATSSAAVSSTSLAVSKLPLPKFSQTDRNGDGWIEWQEAEAAGVPKSLFEKESHQQKGRLTMTEWQLVTLAMVEPVTSKPTSRTVPKTGSAAAPKPPKPVSKPAPPGTGSGGGG